MKIKEKRFAGFKWTDIENPTLPELQDLQNRLNIDKNYLEDALESGHLPKIEKNKDLTFIILRAYTAKENEKVIEVGQISNKIAFFIFKDELITLHRASFELLNNISEDFKSIDELLLHIINEILLTFQIPIQTQAAKMDLIEQQIFLKGGNNLSIENLYFDKSKARLTKKVLLITQNIISQIEVDDKLSSSKQDVKDTIIDLILRTEESIDDSISLLNTYMSFTAQKSNDVMKLLTVFSAFFLPLTFIAGIYGMNFDNMPELRWEYGYFLSLGVMLLIALIIYLWFKKKKIM